MDILRVGSQFSAFLRPELGANVGLIRTPQGLIWIDTTSSPAEMQALLSAVRVNPGDTRLVINTHFHNDHTWGNQLFACPILAHRTCKERMRAALESDWSPAALRSNLAELEKSDPKKAKDFRMVLEGLAIKAPDQVFDDRLEGELGGVNYQVVHLGGHTPDLSIVWLPEQQVLYASDLIFQGRYPYIFDSDIPAWISALGRLLEYEALVIIPGHGVRCGEAEIIELRSYLQDTQERAREHIGSGHSVEESIADPGFPVFPGEKYERLHQANIRYIYNQLLKTFSGGQ